MDDICLLFEEKGKEMMKRGKFLLKRLKNEGLLGL